MNIEAKFSGDNTIEYKLINLDPNYDRSDRKLQLRLYQLTNAKDCFTEEELAGTNINLQLGNMNDVVVQYKKEIISYTEAFKKLYAYNEIRNQEIKNNKIKTHIFTTHELQQFLDGWQTYGYRNDTNTDPKAEDNSEIYTPWNSNKNFYVEVYDLEPEVILPGQSQMLFDIPAKVTETPVYSFTHSYKNIKTLYLLLEATVYYDYSSLMGAPDLKHYIELSEKHKDRVVERFGKKIATSNRVNAKTEIFRIGNLFLSDEYITAGNKSFVDENLEELTPCLLDIKILQEEVEKNKQFFIDTINKYRVEYMDQAGYGDLNAYNNFLEKVIEFAYFNDDYGANLYLYYPFLHLTDIILQPDIIDNWDYSYSSTPYKLVETATVQVGQYFNGDTIDPDQIDKELLDAENITSTPVDTSIPEYDIVINVTPTVSYPDDWLLPSTNIVVNPSASSQYKALFPPILEAYQPAFVGTETSEYEIFFKLSEYTNYEDVAHIDFRITLQSDNTSVVASSSLWHDGIIYKIKSKNDIIEHGNGLYSVKIKTHSLTEGNYDLIAGHWQNNTYYKVQARLGTSWSGWENAEQYTIWRNTQAGQGKFSDWSTVMILKSISKPRVQILNNQNSKLALSYGDMKTEISSSPLFYGQYNQNNLGGTEFLDTYQFILYDAKTEKELENSGILQNNNILEDHTGSVTVTHRFQTNYEEDKQYKVIFNITTSNGYKDSDEYDFVFFPKPQEEIASLEANAFEEDGIIQLTAITSNLLTGNYVITRKKRNEKTWEELQYVQVINGNIKDSNGNIIQSTNINNFKCYLNIYTDFTPESGVEYVYGIERVRQNDYREKRVLSNNIIVNFEYIFLYANNQQLKLKYNSTIDSFKHTVLSSKQDTLGSKFPYITKNGYTYYAEFPFKALISFNSDENNYFFSEINNNNNNNNNNILTFPVRDQKIYDQYGNIINTIKGISYKNEEQNNMEQQNFSTNLTYDNIYKEKQFREEVEKFLNNTEYKLFRSSTEGNFIINLMDIKFTPETALGRMIYSVSGMAYEMADYNIKNLHQYNILPLGTFNPIYETNIIVAGELQGIYTETDNIINHIKEDIAPKSISNNNYYGVTEFIDITDLCITPYPKIDLNSWFNLQSIIENQTTYVEGLNYANGTMFYDIDSKQLKYYFDTPENKLHFLSNVSDINSFGNTTDIYRLETSFKKYNNYMPMKINIDQNKIITVPDTPYILNNQNFISSNTITIEKLREKSNIENEDVYQPVLINYFGRMQIRETDYNILESSFRHTNCNQLSGIFCKTDCNPYFPYLFQDTLEIEKEKIKQINNKNYYNSLNILEIIKEQIRLEIIKERNLINTEQLQWQNNQMWLDDFTLVSLNSLKNIIIETQLNTKIQIGEQQFLCGPAGLVVPFEALENFNAANFEFNFILPENIQSYISYYVFATITYDYGLSFETYKESRKLFEEESDNNEF